MLFDSTLRKELSRSFVGTVVVVVTIVMTIMLIRTLGAAAGGRVSPQDVALMLGYVMLGHLPTILNLSLFVAVVSTLTRLHRDSEMAIWFTSGLSLWRFLKPVLRFAAPILLMMWVLVLFVWPWTNQNVTALRERYEQRSDLSRVAPGQFQTSSNGQRVFFIDKAAPQEGTGRNVFILDQRNGRESVTTAQAGRIEVGDERGRLLVLRHGARTDLDADDGARTISRFDSYWVRLNEVRSGGLDSLPPKARSSIELFEQRSRAGDVELVFRLGQMASAVNMILLGVGLVSGNNRRASSWSLLYALLTFIVYINLLNLTQVWVGKGRLALPEALLLVHGGIALLALLQLAWRSRGAAAWRWRLALR
ncbi:MAG TPA: LPS export ABC transporter permease LptF [Burkholderiaceae bacterium]|nr:LPS export ABC transporter permease LptF [Burkholderiaceae bacterium]HMX11265.1 LPS export ABC transporter permease LptF [Burkholderiaceae bacterium]HMZ01149.1 LPS export ABC transporter permease LptF [Burkholderiaceae bacterium]HNB43045.1 LPS export ABC transporter permease LptF [Burkholderiaceae bacterium]HNG78495.1 LPS export ABC transporter permease LptF [Burkholderiaceae bacterium]